MSLLKLRNKMSRKRRSFKRQEHNKFKKLDTGSWRRPKGKHSKLRQKYNGEQLVSIGHRGPQQARGLHPSGKKEILVHSPKQLEREKNVLIRIGSTVGKKKREQIIKKAQTLGLEIIGKRGKKNESKTAKKTGK